MNKKHKKVIVMGLGYIGLPTAALIAGKKISVLGIDIDPVIVETINKGLIHIVEPDLEDLVKEAVEGGYLQAGFEAVQGDVFLIAVPTPLKGENQPDISYVAAAIETITPYLEEGNLVVIESTCPAGTTAEMAELIYGERPELVGKIDLAYCPERVLPGRIIYEVEHNDRVIGGLDDRSAEAAACFYSLFVKGSLHKTDAGTAEMCKLVENAYRDVNIAFANELSIIADKAGINVLDLIELANKHPRVNILQPGPGVGGHCIAIDPWFLISSFKDETRIIRTAREVNRYKTGWVLGRIREQVSTFEVTNKKKAKIACMGLAYKPDIDDMRESPAKFITEKLINEGYAVLPVEPNLKKFGAIELVEYEEAVEKADIIIFLVGHKEFTGLQINREKVVLDFCGVEPGHYPGLKETKNDDR
ncbi:MAG: UDP-N-acetyl-D-mannosamine dehydrogenase [bacterium]|nr:UDP-N-acetyl-D-mannosamine dehydrogenase [bacterium]